MTSSRQSDVTRTDLTFRTEPLPVRDLLEGRIQTEEMINTRTLVTHEQLPRHPALTAVVVVCI